VIPISWLVPAIHVPVEDPRMRAHKMARTTPLGRAVMLRRIEMAGWTGRAIAAAVAVSERTVRQWLARYRAEGVSGLEDRCSRAQVVANKLAAPWPAMILQLRDCRLTAAEIAALPSLARTTIAGDLAAAGLGRSQALASKPPVVRYQRERPGELAHLDGKKLARFGRVGHRRSGGLRSDR
jgi:hypothetical protein